LFHHYESRKILVRATLTTRNYYRARGFYF